MTAPAVDEQEIAPAPNLSTRYHSERALWLVIAANGASIAFVGDYREAMPYFDRTLYLVTMPAPE